MTALEMTSVKPPFKITRLLRAGWALEALRAGLRLDLFGALSAGARSASQLSAELATDPGATQLLLEVLESLEFLEEKDGLYSLRQIASLYLVAGARLFMGDSILEDRALTGWTDLAKVVKTGEPANKTDKPVEFFPVLAERIFPQNYCGAVAVAGELKIKEYGAGTRVLDIASGSGAWSLPLAEANSDIQVDALDFPAVLEVNRRFAEKLGVSRQYSYISGNWSDCRLPASTYDIVILGHILHSEGKARSQALLAESYRCLKPGGKLVVAEVFADRNSPPSTFVRLFALNMLVQTEEGCVFSEAQLQEMLAGAGFKEIVRPRLPGWEIESPVLLAVK
jgi:ubiquinone/menaquinone biosynthesis C-methylase UbiE